MQRQYLSSLGLKSLGNLFENSSFKPALMLQDEMHTHKYILFAV